MSNTKLGKIYARNRPALRDYSIEQRLLAGIELTGSEVKSIRTGRAKITGSYCVPRPGGLDLIGTYIGAYQKPIADEEAYRTRRLLVTAKQMDDLRRAKDSGMQLVPLTLGTRGRYIKLEIGIGKPRKNYDKRQKLTRKQHARDIRL